MSFRITKKQTFQNSRVLKSCHHRQAGLGHIIFHVLCSRMRIKNLKNTENLLEGLLSLEQENWFRADAKTKRQTSFSNSTFSQFFIKHIP